MVYARQSKNHVPNTILAGFEPFSPFTRGKRKVRSGTVFELHAFVSGFEVAERERERERERGRERERERKRETATRFK